MATPASDARETSRRSALSTAGGLGAILLWSTTVAVARSLSEEVGPASGAATVYGVAGAVSLVWLALRGGERRRVLRLPVRYLIGCGALFVCNMLALFLAVGYAPDRSAVLEVGLVNYLWPALTLGLSVVLLGMRANWMLAPATLVSLAGVFLVLTQGASPSWEATRDRVGAYPAVYALALAAAATWALYSNLARRWAGGRREGGVALFLPATAVVLLAVAAVSGESPAWTARALAEAGSLGAATFAAYLLWDKAMRTGNVALVASASYLTPLLSTILSCLYLSVAPAPRLWLGCGLLVAGAAASCRSVAAGRPPDRPEDRGA